MSALPALPAEIQVGGEWEVNGKVGDVAFTLACKFDPDGARFGGRCIDVSTSDPKAPGGTSHPLTHGDIDGNQMRWTYQSSFLFAKFDVNFAGSADGDHLAGTVTAAGRKGSFTAVRR